MAKMMKSTAQAIERAREIFGNREFNELEWNRAGIQLALRTAIAHDKVVKIERSYRDFYAVKELVEMLNSCAGDDCYDCEWHFEIDEQGRVFQDRKEVSYRMA